VKDNCMELMLCCKLLTYSVFVHRILVGNAEGTRPLARPRRRWEDNIKLDLRKIQMGWYGLDSSGSG
jgi:hypothetical protein